MVELTHRNTRRYGGYLVHMGIVLHVHRIHRQGVRQGHHGRSRPRRDRCARPLPASACGAVESGQNANYQWASCTIHVTQERRRSGRHARRSSASTSRPSSRRPKYPSAAVSNEDLYVNYAGTSDDGAKRVLQAYVFPLVSWIWIGYWVVLFGTLICLIAEQDPAGLAENGSSGDRGETCQSGRLVSLDRRSWPRWRWRRPRRIWSPARSTRSPQS